MKMIYLTNVQIGSGGAQNLQVQKMCEAFYAQLHNDFLLVSPQTEKNKNVAALYGWKKIPILTFLPRAFRYFLLMLLAHRQVRQFQPDIIYSRDIGVVFVYSLFGYDTVYEAHKQFTTVVGDICMRALKKNTRFVTNCEGLKQLFMSRYHISASRIQAVHNGIDVQWIDRVIQRTEKRKAYFHILTADEKAIVYSGTFQKGKGSDVVLAWAKALPQYKFFFLHSPQSGLNKNHPDNVSFLGEHTHEEVEYIIKAADVLLLPNTKDSLEYSLYTSPLKMFEYMGSGVPIVASHIGSIREVLTPENSYVFDPDDTMSGVRHIQTICDYPGDAHQKALQALDDVRGYTWDVRATRVLQFLE